jgi:hypothetical protein
MIAENNLSPAQLRNFKMESKEVQEDILHALNRKPIQKTLKSGLILNANYDYKDGTIALKANLVSSDKVIWHDTYMSDDIEMALDGYETQSYLIDIVYDMLLLTFCRYNEDEDGGTSRGRTLLKKVLCA